jgi:hypothetical protein
MPPSLNDAWRSTSYVARSRDEVLARIMQSAELGRPLPVRCDELWLLKRLVQDKCKPDTGLAKLQRHILSGLGHIVV